MTTKFNILLADIKNKRTQMAKLRDEMREVLNELEYEYRTSCPLRANERLNCIEKGWPEWSFIKIRVFLSFTILSFVLYQLTMELLQLLTHYLKMLSPSKSNSFQLISIKSKIVGAISIKVISCLIHSLSLGFSI